MPRRTISFIEFLPSLPPAITAINSRWSAVNDYGRRDSPDSIAPRRSSTCRPPARDADRSRTRPRRARARRVRRSDEADRTASRADAPGRRPPRARSVRRRIETSRVSYAAKYRSTVDCASAKPEPSAAWKPGATLWKSAFASRASAAFTIASSVARTGSPPPPHAVSASTTAAGRAEVVRSLVIFRIVPIL